MEKRKPLGHIGSAEEGRKERRRRDASFVHPIQDREEEEGDRGKGAAHSARSHIRQIDVH